MGMHLPLPPSFWQEDSYVHDSINQVGDRSLCNLVVFAGRIPTGLLKSERKSLSNIDAPIVSVKNKLGASFRGPPPH